MDGGEGVRGAGGGAGKSSGASGCMTMTKPVFSMRFLVRRSNGRCAVFLMYFGGLELNLRD